MKMRVEKITKVLLVASFANLFISYAALASESLPRTLKSTPKKAKEQANTFIAGYFGALEQEIPNNTNEEQVKDHYRQLARQKEKAELHDQATSYYAASLDKENNQDWQDTTIVHTNDDAISRKNEGEQLSLTNYVVESDLSIKSSSSEIKQHSSASNTFDTSSQKTPNPLLSKSFLGYSDKSNKSVNIAASSLIDDIVAVTEGELDLRLTSYHRLIGILEEFLNSSSPLDPGALKGRWRSLWSNHAKAPENLISKNEIKELLDTQQSQLLDEQHAIFDSFKATYEVLTIYEHDLCAYLPDHTTAIKSSFNLIRQQYQDFMSTLIKLINGYSKAFCDKDIDRFLAYKKQVDTYIEPKALVMSALQPGSCYRISQEKALKILGFNRRGERGMLKPAQNHHVSYLASKSSDVSISQNSVGVYFKNEGHPSLQPGREAMVYHLYSLLKIPMAETGVLFIDNIDFQDSSINTPFFESGVNINPFCVQASGEIKGERADVFLKKHSYHDLTEMLDVTAYFWQALGVLVSYPSDGKTENFIVRKLATSQDKYELVSIDNDAVLEPPTKNNRVNLTSLLLTLPQMEYLVSSSIRNHFAHLTPDILILEWLSALQNTNEQYDSLFKQLCEEKKRQNYRLDQDSSKRKFDGFKHHLARLWKDLSLPIDLKKQELDVPLRALKTISSYFLLHDNEKISVDKLLKELESVVGEAYELLRKTVKDPYECIAALYGAETPLYVAKGGKKKFDSLSDILGRAVHTHEYSVWGEEDPKPLKEWVPLLLEQAAEELADQLIKEKFFSPKEELFPLIALLVQHNCFKIHDIQHFLAFSRSCTLPEKIQLLEIVLPCLSSQPELKWRLDLERLFLDSWHHANPYPKRVQEIKGVWLKNKIVNDALYTQLFDGQGRFKEGKRRGKSLPGRSVVNFYPEENPFVYFKKNPELPGYEYAATDFMRRMGVEGLPFSELAMFYDSQSKKQYPVLLSQAIKGDLVNEVWDNDELFKNLDPHHTGLLILAALFINPEDGKEDNYILSPDRKKLIPIDNDHAFVPGTVWKGEETFLSKCNLGEWIVKGTVQTKTLLFCLDIMNKPIPDSVRKYFLLLDADTFLEDWLKHLVVINDRYQHFFSDLTQFYPQTVLRIPLSKEYIAQVYWKMHRVQEHLKKYDSATYMDLLEIVEPYSAKSYKSALQDYSKKTVKERFLSATSGCYKEVTSLGNRVSAANSRELMTIIAISEKDLIGAASKVKTGPSYALDILQELKQKRIEDEKQRKEIVQGTQELRDPVDCKRLSTQEQMKYLNRILLGSKVISGIALHNCIALEPRYLELRPEFQQLGASLQFLDLRGARNLNEQAFKTIYETCRNLEYLNISGWKKLWYLCHHDEVKKKGLLDRELDTVLRCLPKVTLLPVLKRLVVNDCPLLELLCLCLPEVTIVEANKNPELTVVNIHNEHKTLMTISLEDCLKLSSKMAYYIIQENVQIKSFKSKGSFLNHGSSESLLYQNSIGELYYKAQNYEEAMKWFLKAANQGNADSQCRMGDLYYWGFGVTKDYEEAMKWCFKAADQGNVNAQKNIGFVYQYGLGVTKDYEEAMRWFLKAADQGDATAQYSIGKFYYNGFGVAQDYEEAMRWFLKAADQGYSKAEYRIGELYYNGWGVSKNYREAMKWCRKAANQGHANAQFYMGELYYYGLVVTKYYQEALKWYLKAAEQGHAYAQHKMGEFYYYGQSVTKDYEEAMKWFLKAADQGNVDAQYYMGEFYYKGLGVIKDYKEAIKWYLKAANQDNANAQNRIGELYHYNSIDLTNLRLYGGLVVTKYYKEALKWYHKAANQGNASAQCNIGLLYYSGLGVDKDYEEALKWFLKAADQDYAHAQYCVGSLYCYGRGVIQSYEEAMSWYSKAANQGDAAAQNSVGELYCCGRGVSQSYKEAMKWYLKAAEQGDAHAQYHMGELYDMGDLYDNGWGVPQSYKKARKWYQKATYQGHIDAQYHIGLLYENGLDVGKDYEEARKWYLKAAEQSNATAQNKIGLFYYYGLGVKQDYKEAMKWFLKAAYQGSPNAWYRIGLLYHTAQGLFKHYEEAMTWYLKAARQGNVIAQNNIGVLYCNGQGVKQDYEEAMKWYLKAADRNYPAAQYNIGELYCNGWGVSKSYKEAGKWYQKAAEQGDTAAQYSIGELYHKGWGVMQSYKDAIEWYCKAVRQENTSDCKSEGFLYNNDGKMVQEYKEATKWFCEAAEQAIATIQSTTRVFYDDESVVQEYT